MTNGHIITLKEHVEKLFDEFQKRYDSDRKAHDDAFEEFKKNLDKEGRLLAEKYKSDLTSYPNIGDFNELKEKVTIEFSAAMTKAKALPILISVLALMVAAAAVATAWLKT